MSDQVIDTCVFCRLAKGQLRADIVYEDEAVLAFKDIHPQAPVHVLVIPREHLTALWEVDASHTQILGRLLLAANDIADRMGVQQTGYRIVINTGTEAGQTVDHVHVHVLGGRKLTWPPG
ncbi:MAG: histidine triad nucleotide-binding protein [Chloroflexota bacterium]|jgi:histidine triad (HIT) family protein|nr:histidine triad nucleotide-binding protein [Chloroflexota bacterium]MDQ5867813.1 histidine triad nucleotide-binding protein [Chloroflexota bacterium]